MDKNKEISIFMNVFPMQAVVQILEKHMSGCRTLMADMTQILRSWNSVHMFVFMLALEKMYPTTAFRRV